MNLTMVYHQGQICPRNRNPRTFVLYQLVDQVVRGAFSQNKVLMFYEATSFFATPIYCFTLLFKLTKLSVAYIAIVFMPCSFWASVFFQELRPIFLCTTSAQSIYRFDKYFTS
jgi:hypothetical protein